MQGRDPDHDDEARDHETQDSARGEPPGHADAARGNFQPRHRAPQSPPPDAYGMTPYAEGSYAEPDAPAVPERPQREVPADASTEAFGQLPRQSQPPAPSAPPGKSEGAGSFANEQGHQFGPPGSFTERFRTVRQDSAGARSHSSDDAPGEPSRDQGVSGSAPTDSFRLAGGEPTRPQPRPEQTGYPPPPQQPDQGQPPHQQGQPYGGDRSPYSGDPSYGGPPSPYGGNAPYGADSPYSSPPTSPYSKTSGDLETARQPPQPAYGPYAGGYSGQGQQGQGQDQGPREPGQRGPRGWQGPPSRPAQAGPPGHTGQQGQQGTTPFPYAQHIPGQDSPAGPPSGSGQPPTYDMGSLYPRQDPQGGRRRLMFVGVAVLVVLVVGGATVFTYNFLQGGPEQGTVAKSPSPAMHTPTHSSPTPPPSPTFDAAQLRNTEVDPKTLTMKEVLPAKKITISGKKLHRVAKDTSKKCAKAARKTHKGAFRKALKNAGCLQVLRSTYVDRPKKHAVTVGVAVLPTKAAAGRVQKAAKAGKNVWFKALRGAKGSGARKIAKSGGYSSLDVFGHYVVFSFAADARKIKAGNKRHDLAHLSSASVDYVKKPLHKRGMVTPTPELTADPWSTMF